METDTPDAATTQKFAQSILRSNLRVKAGENVTIEAWPHTLPWAVALARETRRLKAFPLVVYEDEDAYWDTLEDGGAKILGASPTHEWAGLGKTDVYIHMWGPSDRIRLNKLPAKQADAVFGWNPGWYDAARKAGTRGARLEIGRPAPVLAKAYGVDLREWTDEIVAATMVTPAELERRAAPIAKALRTGRTLHVTHSNGTDLTLGLAHRPIAVTTGRPDVGNPKRRFDMLCSLPAGAIRTSLDETVAEGTIVGNRTCYYEDGVATEPRFDFSKGKLVSAQFETGGEHFDAPYKTGGKGRDQPGFLTFGLNPGLHNTPQVEDVEAGTFMVTVGGNRNYGGKNSSSLFGWNIIAGATVEVDGKELALPR